MSDPIKHECGIAVVRLKKPLAYFHETGLGALYGFELLQALMQKQRNRGQDGMGQRGMSQGGNADARSGGS